MDKLDLLGRTSEMARLFGIDFFSVLSRGSQYRVEAVMLRYACNSANESSLNHKVQTGVPEHTGWHHAQPTHLDRTAMCLADS